MNLKCFFHGHTWILYKEELKKKKIVKNFICRRCQKREVKTYEN